MLFFNTFEVLSRPVAQKITQIGLNFGKIDVITSELSPFSAEFLVTYGFPIYQKILPAKN